MKNHTFCRDCGVQKRISARKAKDHIGKKDNSLMQGHPVRFHACLLLLAL